MKVYEVLIFGCEGVEEIVGLYRHKFNAYLAMKAKLISIHEEWLKDRSYHRKLEYGHLIKPKYTDWDFRIEIIEREVK